MFVPSKTMWASVVAPATKWETVALGTGRQSMAVLATHVPPVQVLPPVQTAPALAPEQSPVAPQCWGLRSGSTQLLPHARLPDGQAHVPAVHA